MVASIQSKANGQLSQLNRQGIAGSKTLIYVYPNSYQLPVNYAKDYIVKPNPSLAEINNSSSTSSISS
jgi:hypothetical protein